MYDDLASFKVLALTPFSLEVALGFGALIPPQAFGRSG